MKKFFIGSFIAFVFALPAHAEIVASTALSDYAKKSDIPDTNAFATTQYVNAELDKKVTANADIPANTTGAPKVTYNAQGLVTGAAQLTANDMPADMVKSANDAITVERGGDGVYTVTATSKIRSSSGWAEIWVE